MASTTVNFNLKTAGYVNYANQTLTFTLLNAGAEAATGDQSYVTLPGTVTATSAANGDGSVSLFRNGKSSIESVYEVVFPNRERAKFIIPSGSSTIELATLLVDHVPSGASTQQSSVYAAAIQRANHTGTQALSTISDAGTIASQNSNGVNIDGGAIDGTVIGANSAAAGTFAALTSSSVDINGGAIDGAVIGANSAAAGTFSALTAPTTNLTDATDKRLMTDAQETKLDAIDTDVTTLSLPSGTVISDFAKTVLDDTSAAAVKTTLGITDATAQVNFVPNSISFNAATDNLSIADPSGTGEGAMDVGTGDFSLSFFARINTSDERHIFSKLSGTGYSIKFNSGSLILTMQDSGGAATFTLATGLNDNKWHTYVVTVDRDDTVIAYVDNVAQTGVSASAAGSLNNPGAFLIGNNNSVASSNLFALGYYIILHKSELSAANASQIYFSPDRGLTAVVPTLMVDLRRADRTFKDISSSGLTVTTNNTITFNQERITSLDGVGDINCSSISSDVATTGLNVIFDGTDTGDNKITLTDNLASALDITESTNSYLKFTTTNTGEKVVFGKDLDISGDHDLIIGTSTGTKIGTAVTQKIGFFNATPAVQQSTVNTTTGFTEGSGGTAAKTVSTFTGDFGTRAYTIGDIVKALKTLGLLQKDN